MSEDKGNVSDGYHTFNELYEHRNTLFAYLLLLNKERAWKTLRNQNGEKWPGWFIAGMDTDHGQVSYHMPIEWWVILSVREKERNDDYDGHTSQDVLDRMMLQLGGLA